MIVASDSYISRGVAAFAIDMPGTGQAPLLIDVGAERMFSAAIDYLETRSDIDSSRIVVQGRSWSGYWAAVLAYTERDRIRGAAVHGVGIHHYYQPEWQQTAILSSEYLFDIVKPSPVPLILLFSVIFSCVNGSKISFILSFGIPIPKS